ncbi:MAG: vWA domain-containing protein [Thermodesulfobacteriota bacterium]
MKDMQDEKMQPPEGMDIPSDPKGQPDQNAGEDEQKELSEKTTSSKSVRPGDIEENAAAAYRNHETAKNIKRIMKVLEGSFQRSMATKTSHPGGMPRRWRKMDTLELEDADPLEFFLWSDTTSPTLPRVQMREKESTGGEIAILRDVSTSMMGIYSEWASSVVRGVMELARKKNMRVGYLEFNHKADPYRRQKGRRSFFTREYPWLLDIASETDCSGNTNYEEALKNTVEEFKGRGRRNKHILFLTDGIPTSGDISFGDDNSHQAGRPNSDEKQLIEYLNAGRLEPGKKPRPLREIVKRTQRLGIRIHSIFIGSKTYPKILQRISEETSGTQFVAFRNDDRIMQVERRDKFMSKLLGKDVDSFDPIKAAFTQRRIHTVTGKL